MNALWPILFAEAPSRSVAKGFLNRRLIALTEKHVLHLVFPDHATEFLKGHEHNHEHRQKDHTCPRPREHQFLPGVEMGRVQACTPEEIFDEWLDIQKTHAAGHVERALPHNVLHQRFGRKCVDEWKQVNQKQHFSHYETTNKALSDAGDLKIRALAEKPVANMDEAKSGGEEYGYHQDLAKLFLQFVNDSGHYICP